MPSLVEIGSVVLGKNIFKFRQRIFAIFSLSPLEKRFVPLFEQNRIHITQGSFVLSLGEIGLVVMEKTFRQVPYYLPF